MLGGKGGFGSMLRAIGAQIEKTTSREACRDLSGRRMRDVNNEKKLKDWMGKQGERAEEKERCRQERLERRKQTPTHKFHDPKYDQQKSAVSENLEDALMQGLNKAGSSNGNASATATLTSEENRKRKLPDDSPVDKKKAAEWLGMDIDNISDLESDSEDDSSNCSVKSTCGTSSGHPSIGNDSPCPVYDESESKSDISSGSRDKPKAETEIKSGVEEDPKNSLREAFHPPKADQGPVKDNHGQVSEDNMEEKSIDLEDFNSCTELEALGLDHLKLALAERGLKCGGTLEERTKRLFSVKGLTKEQIDPALFAKPAKGKNSKGKK
ncbi:splicing regulator SDE2-like isoform X2 [Lineus longissimus]